MDYLLVIFLPVPSLSLPFAPASPLSHGCHLPATGRIWAGSNIAHSQNKITSEGDGNYATRHMDMMQSPARQSASLFRIFVWRTCLRAAYHSAKHLMKRPQALREKIMDSYVQSARVRNEMVESANAFALLKKAMERYPVIKRSEWLPSLFEVGYAVIDGLEREGSYEMVVGLLEKFLIYPRAKIRENIANLLQNMRIKGAKRYFKRAKMYWMIGKDWEEVLDCLKVALSFGVAFQARMKTKAAGWFIELARGEIAYNELQLAEKHVSTACWLNPARTTEYMDILADGYLRLAITHAALGKQKDAKLALETAIKRAPLRAGALRQSFAIGGKRQFD